jgi:hypothetical protein
MDTKRKNPADDGGNSFYVRVGQHNTFFDLKIFKMMRV